MPARRRKEFSKQAVRVFKALSDPTRYEMVLMLAARDEVGCGEFLQTFDLSAPALSHHYRVLESCGLIEARKEGQHAFFRLNRKALERYLPDFLRVHAEA